MTLESLKCGARSKRAWQTARFGVPRFLRACVQARPRLRLKGLHVKSSWNMAQWGFELEDDGSHILSLKISPPRLEAECGLSSDIAREAFSQLAAYFGGRLKNFSLPIRMVGTDFQMSVWKALRTVPFGETVSYSRLAAMASRPKLSCSPR